MTERSRKWDNEEKTECEYYHVELEKEIAYKQLMKRLAEERKRLARKFKEPDRDQTTLDNFSVEK
jgi:hypothetical protein